MKNRRTTQQPKVRSKVARDAWFQTGAGSHGGSARAQSRRDRQTTKQSLRRDHA